MNHPESHTKKPSDYLEPRITDIELNHLWEKIEPDIQGSRLKRSGYWTLAAALTSGLLMFGLVFASPLAGVELFAPAASKTITDSNTSPTSLPVGEIHSSAQPMAFQLDDGSQISLSPESRLIMKKSSPSETRLHVETGRITCDVTKNEKRDFYVVAGSVEVRVIGTLFSVERARRDDLESISVSVERGLVEVKTKDGEMRRLKAGESWSVRQPFADVQAQHHASQGVPDVAPPSTDYAKGPKQHPTKQKPASTPEGPDLFLQARTLRNQGDAQAAARLFAQFLRASPQDSRSGLAALELGRLKMDQLGDAAGAIAPLKKAEILGSPGLRDDALARLVLAYARLGQNSACLAAKRRYLQSFPRGVHHSQVSSLCVDDALVTTD